MLLGDGRRSPSLGRAPAFCSHPITVPRSSRKVQGRDGRRRWEVLPAAPLGRVYGRITAGRGRSPPVPLDCGQSKPRHGRTAKRSPNRAGHKKSRPAFPKASPEIRAGTRRVAPAAGEIRASICGGVGGAARGREGTRGDTKRGDTAGNTEMERAARSARWGQGGFGSAAAVAMGKLRHGRVYGHRRGWQGAEKWAHRERSPTRRSSELKKKKVVRCFL